jgi:parvulin-like peptidyl-prolyl isomerase
MTFDEAVVLHEQTSGQAAPMQARLSDLPEPVREVVKPLKAGQISTPTEVQGGTYLFYVESWRKADPTLDAAAREDARNELFHRRFDEVSLRLLEKLEEEAGLEVFTESLPFDYVPEDGSP